MVNKQASIKLNFVMNIILNMSSFIFPIITFPYISRTLMPEGTGKVAFATSLISYFNMFAQLGIPTYGIRICAQVRDDKDELTRTVHELLFINIGMSLISYILLIITLIFVPRLRADRLLYIIISITIILSAIGMEWIYKALEQYIYITVRSLIFKVIALVAMFLLVREKTDYIIYGGITILASSASNVLNFVNAHKYLGIKPVGGYHLKRHFKPIMIFFGMACATTIYTNLDTIMLGLIKSDIDVGYYNAAVKIKNILVSIVTSLGTVLLPRTSYYIQHNMIDKFKSVNEKAVEFIFLIAAPLMLYFMIFAKYGIYFISGTAYKGSILPMQIIMPTLVLVGITNILGLQILVPLGRERAVLHSEVAGAITDLVLNLFLIPKLGVPGAAIGTLIAEFVVFVFQYLNLKNEYRTTFRKIQYYKIGLGLIFATIFSTWIINLNLDAILTIILSSIFFFGVYVGILIVLQETFFQVMFEQIIKKIKNRN